jgi:hypothetical protein
MSAPYPTVLPHPRAQPLPERAGAASPGRVPAEFVGLARRLRDEIAAAYPEAEIRRETLIYPFRPRPGFVPMPRHTALKRLANKLRSPPALGRLRAVAKFEAGELRVVELWAKPAKLEHDDWAEDEPALAILLRSITIRPPEFAETNHRITGIGLHALARRYQRGTRSDRAVLADLLALAEGYPAAVAAGGEFAIPVPGGGRWIGAVAPGEAVAIVRTFVDGS